jgi:drug/metabolite transporter (DMT)-like permease
MLEIAGPLIAALIYTITSFLIRRALRGGINIALQFAVTNIFTVLIVGVAALFLSEGKLVLNSWWPAVTIVLFLSGQLLVMTALRLGDSSIQTPLMGVKVLFAPIVVAIGFTDVVPREIWIAAVLATVAVFLIGFRRDTARAFQALPVAATIGSAVIFATSDTIIAEMSGPLGNAAFLATLLLGVGILSVPVGVGGLIAQLRAGASRPGGPAVRALIGGSVLMGVQFALFVTALSLFSNSPRTNVLYSTRGLWSVALLYLLNRAGQGHHMEQAPMGVIARRFVGAALLVAAVVVAV